MLTRKKIALAVVALVVLLLTFPFTVTVTPKWNVKVVDEHGQPISGAYVEEFANQWTLDFNYVEAVCTDARGEAQFPRQTMRLNAVTHALKWVTKLGPHSSLGPDIKTGAETLGYGEMPGDNADADWTGGGRNVDSTFRLHKCAQGYTGYHCAFDYKYFFNINGPVAKQIADCQSTPGRRVGDPRGSYNAGRTRE